MDGLIVHIPDWINTKTSLMAAGGLLVIVSVTAFVAQIRRQLRLSKAEKERQNELEFDDFWRPIYVVAREWGEARRYSMCSNIILAAVKDKYCPRTLTIKGLALLTELAYDEKSVSQQLTKYLDILSTPKYRVAEKKDAVVTLSIGINEDDDIEATFHDGKHENVIWGSGSTISEALGDLVLSDERPCDLVLSDERPWNENGEFGGLLYVQITDEAKRRDKDIKERADRKKAKDYQRGLEEGKSQIRKQVREQATKAQDWCKTWKCANIAVKALTGSIFCEECEKQQARSRR